MLIREPRPQELQSNSSSHNLHHHRTPHHTISLRRTQEVSYQSTVTTSHHSKRHTLLNNGPLHPPQQRPRKEDRNSPAPPRTTRASPFRSSSSIFPQIAHDFSFAHRRRARQHSILLPPKHPQHLVEPLPKQYELGQGVSCQTSTSTISNNTRKQSTPPQQTSEPGRTGLDRGSDEDG